jgi:hypothetical protein
VPQLIEVLLDHHRIFDVSDDFQGTAAGTADLEISVVMPATASHCLPVPVTPTLCLPGVTSVRCLLLDVNTHDKFIRNEFGQLQLAREAGKHQG